eukprot:CAMPEP_0119569002 /NCGR_PEP_ID=MMETSP1352-20130426/40455_1 /TAXON_ID=265584 /ORGANISM="Stauroneis constricta, Strain CCMP1120" /LENGTH=322 /DNA_ID=CAMNT_0007618487 /DNA_START=71 /DNA_END=1039 /DNA_ORIENTATION=+
MNEAAINDGPSVEVVPGMDCTSSSVLAHSRGDDHYLDGIPGSLISNIDIDIGVLSDGIIGEMMRSDSLMLNFIGNTIALILVFIGNVGIILLMGAVFRFLLPLITTLFEKLGPAIESSGKAFATRLMSPLQPGKTVIKTTIAMDLPDRSDRESFLNTLNSSKDAVLSDKLEAILQRKPSIISASSSRDVFRFSEDAANRYFVEQKVALSSTFNEDDSIVATSLQEQSSSASTSQKGSSSAAEEQVPSTTVVATILVQVIGGKAKVSNKNTLKAVEDTLCSLMVETKLGNVAEDAVFVAPNNQWKTVTKEGSLIEAFPELKSF